MSRHVNLMIIGTGSAGTTAAAMARKAGWSVGIADSRSFGGTCAQRGCDPKKVLVGAADLVEWSRRFHARGIVSEATLDWSQLIRFKRTFTDPVPEHIESWLKAEDILALHGTARFVDDGALQVGDTRVTADNILIATGAVPVPLPILGSEALATNEDFLAWERLPKRIIFVGAGYISMEFAHIARTAGSEVTVIDRNARPLPGFDPQLVESLLGHTRRLGIEVLLESQVTRIERVADGVVVHVRQAGKDFAVRGDVAVHGAGRVADIDALDLSRGHVQREAGGITVTSQLRSPTNARVYAAGDAAATAGMPLTPVAVMESRIAAHNMIHGAEMEPDYRAIPTVLYTSPRLAAVGMHEAEAMASGRPIRVNRGDTTNWYSSRRLAAEGSGYAVLIDEEADRVVGAHIMGPHAEELINVFSLAIREGIPASRLRDQPWAYPTGASDIAYMV